MAGGLDDRSGRDHLRVRSVLVQHGLEIVLKVRRWSRQWVPTLVVLAIAALSLAQEPASTFEGHLSLGQYFLENNAAGRAVSEFEAAVRLAPERAEAHYNLGNALRLWGDAKGAEEALGRALEIQPRFPEAHFVLGLLFGDQVGSDISVYPNSKPPSHRSQATPRRISTSESFTGRQMKRNQLWKRFNAR